MSKKDDDPYELDEVEVRISLRNGIARDAFEGQLRKELSAATEVSPTRVSFHSTERMLDYLGMETEMKEKRFLDARPKA